MIQIQKVVITGFYWLGVLLSLSLSAAAQPDSRQRLIVITDIGNEPDDSQSNHRLMLYANQIDLEGIIASTSVHQKKYVRTELIEKVIAGFAAVLYLEHQCFSSEQVEVNSSKA
ncbi:nucleoside hydrolase-like domain-containing protein [Spirosoma jeollabukense]